MDKPVRIHLQELEYRIQVLSVQMMDDRVTQCDRNRLEAELRVAQQALEYYRKALELERKLKAE
jgi:hypothetical protein